jgi:DNA-binding SARP family transcriptional activator/tetratricopeptide (TPR) repeat protein
MSHGWGMDQPRFRILGSLELWDGAEQVQVAGRQLPVVLAALLLHANRVVSVDRLTECLWGEQQPAAARRLLHGCVAELRRTLRGAAADPEHQPLVTRPPGYRLEVRPGELDLDRFGELTVAARQRLAQPSTTALEEAARLLRDALALWRGPVLDGVTLNGFSGELAALEERRLTALEERIDVDLRLGRHPALVGELQLYVETHPLRERLWGQLMLALARNHRQADALAAYQQVRGVLVDQLGIEPGAALRTLQQAILVGDDVLAAYLRGADPDVDGDGVPAAAPPPPAPPPAPAPVPARAVDARPPEQLPLDVRGFTGRRQELAALDAALTGTDVSVFALAGTAGVGKTALAVHWAHQVAGRFPDGQLYVNLRGFDPNGQAMAPAEAVRGFLDALGVPPERVPATLDAQAALYRTLLAGRRVLVVLDNARDAEQARPLLPGTPTTLVLVTSRSRLTPLVAEGAFPLALDVLSETEARELLGGRLGADRVAAEPDAVEKIIDRAARLPLALAIAAAQAQQSGFPLAALAAELDDVDDRLEALDAGDQATRVQAVFSWSYATLSAAAARLFRLLGLHPGPDTSAAAAASLSGEPLPGVRRLLTELVRANLISEHAPGRYTFHDLLRAYAAELGRDLDAEPDRRAATVRLLDHYVHTAFAADRLLSPYRDDARPASAPAGGVHLEPPADYQAAMAWLGAEHATLLAALRHAAAGGFTGHAYQLAWGLDTFLYRRGHWHDMAAAWETVIGAGEPPPDAYRYLAEAHTLLRRHDAAEDALRRALDLQALAGDQVGQAHAHRSYAMLADKQGRQGLALEHARQSLALYRATDHLPGQANALNAVGWHLAQHGRHTEALDYCGQALALHQRLGARNGEANTWDSLGYAHHLLAHHAEADECYSRAVDLFHQLGDRYNEADTLVSLGDARLAAGDPDAARATWTRALRILTDIAHPDADIVRDRLNG